MARYDIDSTTLGTLLDDPEVVAIIDKHSPGLLSNPMIGMAKGMPAAQVLGMAGSVVDASTMEAIRADIAALE